MRVRIRQRRSTALESRPMRGDNIFSDIRLEHPPRAVVPGLATAKKAQVIRPTSFQIDPIERVTSASSEHARGIGCISANGTVITPSGPRPASVIAKGDKVLTRDNGFQTVRWCTHQLDHAAMPSLVEISAGAISEGKPDSDLCVTGSQRLLVTGTQVSESFGASEVLVRAGDLLHLDGFEEVHEHVGFVALVFDQHEIMRVNQTWVASLQPDHVCRNHLSKLQCEELFKIFPALKGLPIERSYPAARPLLSARFARQVCLNAC
ncbi:hypothetical protein NBRC116601_06270 [Cognatishimia sp. WU-CL00825]|uniref:Hint domain-containing protein n=1 Tax=Cognatishimia sp. WU-CL00825 TaxID=3127658 RepID=UPI00310BA604